MDWHPSSPLVVMQKRAEMLAQIRAFFASCGVLEVDTPVLSVAGATDPHIASFVTEYRPEGGEGRQCFYLHTSPEFPMKRLLAAGVGSIYQVCKVFRNGEQGRWHNPEFTLLEWYRVGFDHHALMDEMDALLAEVAGCGPALRVTYRDVFLQNTGLDPLEADIPEVREKALALGVVASLDSLEGIDRNGWLDLILTHRIVDTLGQNGRPTFVYDYPASQAAMAQVRPGPPAVAERFEVYLGGVELANGFHELRDPKEQRKRLEADREERHRMGLPLIPLDERLLDALSHGLPPCAGVALGIDRLLMAVTGATSIDAVLAFPVGRA